jgi:hypothetical protein
MTFTWEFSEVRKEIGDWRILAARKLTTRGTLLKTTRGRNPTTKKSDNWARTQSSLPQSAKPLCLQHRANRGILDHTPTSILQLVVRAYRLQLGATLTAWH